MSEEGKKYWMVVAGFAAVLVTIILAFSNFVQSTTERTISQANQYVTDTTTQTSNLVSAIMSNAERDIETIATLATESESGAETFRNEEWLNDMSDISPFDSIDFVDAQGIQHSYGRDPVDVSDREYFTKAMNGEAGVEAILNSRMTGENLLYFYAPVREGVNGPVVGLLLAHYNESRMNALLSAEYFGYPSPVFLCLTSGEVVAASDSSYVGRNLYEEATNASSEEGAQALLNAFNNEESATFTYEVSDGVGSACIQPFSVSGTHWMLMETFPAAATDQMIDEATVGGWSIVSIVVTVFVLVLVLIILYNRHRHKELSETAKDREDIQKGVVKLAERLVLIDLKEWRYRCMDDTYVAEHETCDGSFTKLIDALQRMVVGDEAKKEVGRLYHREYIESLLPLGCDDVRFEYQLNRSNKFTWEDISLVCVGRSKEGIPLRLVYITQDVTELKQREKQMQKAMEDSYRAAVTANNAKSDFLSRMSHDIRTPMNAIIGMTELARMYEGDWKKVDDCLSKITLSSNHLLALINEVLDLSMIENGRLVLNEAEVDLHATFEEVETVFAQRCEEAGIVLVFETKNIRHYWVVVDDLRLQQVFINLVGNAVKFTPRGGRVEVKVRELPTRVGHSSDYEITVADTGCGMSAEFVKHAFEPFEREHDSRVESVEGTGLGLSIVYSIVQLLGGTIEVESEPGVGTTFTIRITLHYLDKLAQATPVLGESVASEDEEEVPVEGPAPLKSAQASEATEEEMHEKARELLQDKRVLLVEDNALNSEIAAALLKTLGLHVEVAENGQEALDLLEASEPQHFDAVLMDVQMPIMNGLEATRALRQSERADLCDLPVIVLSANAFAEDILESKRAGANDHLSKPISIQSISAALVRILEERAHAQC